MARTPAAEARHKTRHITSTGPTRFYLAFCPTCGLARSAHYVGTNGEHKIGWNLDQDQHGHFGALFESRGRASIKLVRFTEPNEDDEALFPRVKRQLLDGVIVWLRNGWLEEQDLLAAIAASKAPPPLPKPKPTPAAAPAAQAAPPPAAKPAPTRRKKAPTPPVTVYTRPLAPAFAMGERVRAGTIEGVVVDISDPASILIRTDQGGVATVGRSQAKRLPEDMAPNPVEEAHARLSSMKRHEYAAAERLLDDLEEQHKVDVTDARSLLEEFRDIERSEFDEASEYRDARDEAWGEFVDTVGALEMPEAEEAAAPMAAPAPAPTPAVPHLVLPTRTTPEWGTRLVRHLRALDAIGLNKRQVQAEMRALAYQLGTWVEVCQEAIVKEEERTPPNRELLARLAHLCGYLQQALLRLTTERVDARRLAEAILALEQAYTAPSASAPPP